MLVFILFPYLSFIQTKSRLVYVVNIFTLVSLPPLVLIHQYYYYTTVIHESTKANICGQVYMESNPHPSYARITKYLTL